MKTLVWFNRHNFKSMLCFVHADCPLSLPLEVFEINLEYTPNNPVPGTLGHSSSMIL